MTEATNSLARYVRPPQATNPETHIPFPERDWKWKMANFFLEKWGRKLTMKVLQAAQPIITIIVGKIANTPESEQVISIAIGAAILGVLDMVISWVTGGKLQSLQKIQEESEMEGEEQPTQRLPFIDPQPTMVGIQPLGLGEALSKPDRAPPGIWVIGIKEQGETIERRRFFVSEETADAYLQTRCAELAAKGKQADAWTYEPGDVMP